VALATAGEWVYTSFEPKKISMLASRSVVNMSIYHFTVVIEPDEQGFHAYVPALPGCHTFADTLDEAQASISEAIELHVQGLKDGWNESY
jgi:predicted RNase H-like HicB family nuclease